MADSIAALFGRPLPNDIAELSLIRKEVFHLIAFERDVLSVIERLARAEKSPDLESLMTALKAFRSLRPLARNDERRRADLVFPYLDEAGYFAFGRFVDAVNSVSPADAKEALQTHLESLERLEYRLVRKIEQHESKRVNGDAVRKRGGQPVDQETFDADHKLFVEWQDSRKSDPYKTIADFAAENGLDRFETEARLQRHRKRLQRKNAVKENLRRAGRKSR